MLQGYYIIAMYLSYKNILKQQFKRFIASKTVLQGIVNWLMYKKKFTDKNDHHLDRNLATISSYQYFL